MVGVLLAVKVLDQDVCAVVIGPIHAWDIHVFGNTRQLCPYRLFACQRNHADTGRRILLTHLGVGETGDLRVECIGIVNQ